MKKTAAVACALMLGACAPNTRPDIGPSARYLQLTDGGRIIMQMTMPNAAVCSYVLARTDKGGRSTSGCSMSDRSRELPWSAAVREQDGTLITVRAMDYDTCFATYARQPKAQWAEVCMERPA